MADTGGINPFAYYDPQDYAAQLAIQRQQMLGQQLMQQPMGQGGYAGLAEAGNRILGAFLSRRADQKLADYYNQPDAQTGQQAARTPPQPSAPTYPNANVDEEGNPIPQQAAPLGGYSTGAMDEKPSAPSNRSAMDEKPSDYYSLPPRFQRVYDRIPHIPGMPAAQAVGYFETNPGGYQAEWAKQFEATPEQKNAAFVNPGDTEAQRSAIGGIMTKNAAIPIRNAVAVPDGKGGTRFMYAPPQAPAGYQYVTGNNGQPMLVPTPGGPEAVTGSAAASQIGRATGTPAIGYVNGQPVATNQAALLGNGPGQPQYSLPAGPNINANNPLNMQPGGQEARYATPTAGLGAAWENLSNYANRGINTVNGIVRAWAGPNAPPEYAANVAKSLGVDPNQPLNLRDPNVKGLLIDAMRPNETGNRYGPQSQQGGAMLPELPAGQKPYMEAQGKDAGERHDATVQAAAESPMRINVLDNIIGLSQSGVATGPGQEWQNSVLGYASNLPGLSRVMGTAKDNVAKFQELQKFTYQNAIRSWQAAGGTGTDAQMESMAHANPNDKLFPQALQQIARWGKAAELAVQGKANAQDRWLAQNGQTPQNQIAFENAWRNNFDPKVFQYSLMTPQEKFNLAHTQLKTPQAAKAFLAKQQTLQAMGAIQ